jgi:hypothetical protein
MGRLHCKTWFAIAMPKEYLVGGRCWLRAAIASEQVQMEADDPDDVATLLLELQAAAVALARNTNFARIVRKNCCANSGPIGYCVQP